MTRILVAALLALLATALAPAQPANSSLRSVSYAELGKLVRANRGKVVVVYFWAHY